LLDRLGARDYAHLTFSDRHRFGLEEGAMPTYEYRCEACKKDFDVALSISERAKASVKCPGCGSTKVNPQMAIFSAKTSRKG
jgi:putative FmdB family regulatory protein